MAPVLVSKPSSTHRKSKKAPLPTEHEPANVPPDDVNMERDEAEEELERLVFGDSTGFREGIRSFAHGSALGVAAEEEEEGPDEEEHDQLQDVADADVWLNLIQSRASWLMTDIRLRTALLPRCRAK